MRRQTLRILAVATSACILMCALTIYGKKRRQHMEHAADSQTIGSLSRLQIEERAAYSCVAVLGMRGDLRISAMERPLYRSHRESPPSWAVECCDAATRPVAEFVYDTREGRLTDALRFFRAKDRVSGRPVRGYRAGADVGRAWLARLRPDCGMWRLNGMEQRFACLDDRQWISTWQGPTFGARVAVRVVDGSLVWLHISGTRGAASPCVARRTPILVISAAHGTPARRSRCQ